MPIPGLATLPLTLWTEMLSWGRQQLERQGRWFDVAFRRPEAPTWATANEVVFEAPALKLRAFERSPELPALATPVDAVHQIPVVIITPQINHSFICDYSPSQSLVRTLQSHGFARVHAVEWKSATQERADESLDDLLEMLEQALDALGGRAHLVGLCQGGWMSLLHAALAPEQVESLILAAAPVDFHAAPGGVNWLAWITPMLTYQSFVQAGGGIMRGEMLRMGFNQLRPLERYAGNYLKLWAEIDNPAFLERYARLQSWYNLPQDIAGATYLRIVKELFKENRLVKGTLECRGQQVDLARVTAPLYMIAGTRDHITPRQQLFAARKYVQSEVVYSYLAEAGHIGVFMGSKSLGEVWPVVLDDLYREFRLRES